MNEKVNKILELFAAINRIPRCSGNEKEISGWILHWAKDRCFTTQTDDAGNLVIHVPASDGFEQAPTVVFQAHLDMVCEKNPGSNHDFSKDPIRMTIEGDWLVAEETSLGADNGVAVAIGLALADDTDILRPPMELLFTVEEETGLTGVRLLDKQMVSGKILLNLDSEDEGVFTIGCAGGRDTTIRLPVTRSSEEKNASVLEITVSGLRGGHSGVDIAKFRGNANRILGRLLMKIRQKHPLQLISMSGGTARNAIARDARAFFACDVSVRNDIQATAGAAGQIVQQEYASLEKDLCISVKRHWNAETGIRCLSTEDSEKAIRLILAIPSGVAGMSADFPHLVETSSNLAKIYLDETALRIQTSQRSNVMSRLEEITSQIESIAHIAGAEYESNTGYPAWQPDMDAALLARCKTVYTSLFDVEPKVEIIHAGLECAILGSKYPEMEMISFGPTMVNPHSPGERLYLPSVERIWQFIAALLASYQPPV